MTIKERLEELEETEIMPPLVLVEVVVEEDPKEIKPPLRRRKKPLLLSNDTYKHLYYQSILNYRIICMDLYFKFHHKNWRKFSSVLVF